MSGTPVHIVYPDDNGFFSMPKGYGKNSNPQEATSENSEMYILEAMEAASPNASPDLGQSPGQSNQIEDSLIPLPNAHKYEQSVPRLRPLIEQLSAKGFSKCKMHSKDPFHTMFLGPTGSTKTTCVRNFVWYLSTIHNIAVVELFSKKFYFETWIMPGRAHKFISKTLIDKIREDGRYMKKNDPSWYQIIIIDDCLGENFHSDKYWSELISICREENIFLIFSIQYLLGVTPAIRDNIQKYVCCCMNNKGIDNLCDLSRNPDKKAFKRKFTDTPFTKGSPLIFNTSPGEYETMQITLPDLPPEKMIRIGY